MVGVPWRQLEWINTADILYIVHKFLFEFHKNNSVFLGLLNKSVTMQFKIHYTYTNESTKGTDSLNELAEPCTVTYMLQLVH